MYQKHDVNENLRKTQKADITRKLAFLSGVEKMGFKTTSLQGGYQSWGGLKSPCEVLIPIFCSTEAISKSLKSAKN